MCFYVLFDVSYATTFGLAYWDCKQLIRLQVNASASECTEVNGSSIVYYLSQFAQALLDLHTHSGLATRAKFKSYPRKQTLLGSSRLSTSSVNENYAVQLLLESPCNLPTLFPYLTGRGGFSSLSSRRSEGTRKYCFSEDRFSCPFVSQGN